MFLAQLLVFLVSSGFTAFLTYFKVATNNLNIIITICLVLLIILINQVSKTGLNVQIKKYYQLGILLVSSIFVQVFVVSSGGFYSPFLILIHLYTLTLSFLMDLGSAIFFLIFTFFMLVLNIYLNPALLARFKEDPWTLILYVISFVVVVPLVHTLTKTYHLKGIISEKLKNLMVIGGAREESILKSLNELVIVTDSQYKIISANEPVEKYLNMPNSALVNKNFFDVIDLKDTGGNKANGQSLYLDKVLVDKATRFVEGFSLSSVDRNVLLKVVIQVRPITDQKGNVTQIVFVITESNISLESHANLEKLKEKQHRIFNEIRVALMNSQIPGMKTKLELYSESQEDLMTAQELEDHNIKPNLSPKDVAYFCNEVMKTKQDFAKDFNVYLQFVLPKEEIEEAAALSLLQSGSELSSGIVSKFTCQVDKKWVEIMLNKLLEIMILISSTQANPRVEILVERGEGEFINVKFISNFLQIPLNYQEILTEYYGELGLKTNLKFGSGLEGFIAKKIAEHLGIYLEVINFTKPDRFGLSLKFSRSLGI